MVSLQSKELKSLIAKPLSDDEIKNALDGKVNIVKYSELKNMKHIDELLGKYGRSVILVETKKNNGHWISVVRNNNCNNGKGCIIVTDSYGLYPENELNYVPRFFLKLSDQKRGYLFNLLDNQPLEVRYSQYRFQKMKPNVNTCGRYSIVRAITKDLYDEDEFAEFLRSTKYTPDELVTVITSDV